MQISSLNLAAFSFVFQTKCLSGSSYTVTKANQNEALLWKVAVLGKEKPPVSAGTFFPSPTLVFYIPPCRKCLPA
jgi:hypothetical protein